MVAIFFSKYIWQFQVARNLLTHLYNREKKVHRNQLSSFNPLFSRDKRKKHNHNRSPL